MNIRLIKKAKPALSTRLAQKCLFGIFGLRKTPFGRGRGLWSEKSERPLRYFAPPRFASPANHEPTVRRFRLFGLSNRR